MEGSNLLIRLFLFRGNLFIELFELACRRGRLELYHWLNKQRGVVHRRVCGRMEERVERIEFLLRQWIELVVVTNGTPSCQSHPDLHGRACAIDGIPEDIFFIDRAAFTRSDIAAIETSGD